MVARRLTFATRRQTRLIEANFADNYPRLGKELHSLVESSAQVDQR